MANNLRIKEFHLLIFPPYFWFLIFFIIPLLIIIIYSFSEKEVYGGVNLIFTLENYKLIFDDLYLKIYLYSFLTATVSTIFTLLISYPIAYYMAFSKPRTKIIILFLIVLPFWTNMMIRLYSMIILLGNEGVLNSILLNIGVIREPLQMMHTTFSVYLGFIYWNLPFMVLPIFASLDKIDISMLEASMDLGANKIKTFFKITLPYSIPGVVAGIIFTFVPTLGNFVIPDFLGGTRQSMIGNVITAQFLQSRNWPFGSALSVILIFVVMLFIVIYLRFANPMKNKHLSEV